MNIDIIEQKRIEKNLTVTKLCSMVGIDRKTYYKILQRPEGTRFSTILKLTQVLNLNAKEKGKLLA